MTSSQKEAIDTLFDKIIRIKEENDFFIAIDPVTHIAETGVTKEEAIVNLKNALMRHFEVIGDIIQDEVALMNELKGIDENEG